MMKIIKIVLASILLFTFVLGAALVMSPQSVTAQTPEELACTGSGGSWSGGNCTQGKRTVTGTLKNAGNILIFITAAISVLMVIIGGLRYTLSNGDQGSITSAKNTILYAIVGVVVSVVAYAIVNFVLSNI